VRYHRAKQQARAGAPETPPMTQVDSFSQLSDLTAGSKGADYAAELLAAPEALTSLSLEESRVVISFMTPRFYEAGTTFIKEGDSGDDGFMALLVEGDVVVERITVSRTDPVTIRVLGPGSLIGEIGLVDHEPRSASCTASSDVWCAVLTREAIEAMIAQRPAIAARLLLGISANIAERLRDTNRQLKLYARLATAMRDELANVITPRPQ
jgi:CRP/FNR family transcriptional regulator, cyclic AMP receptor protein